MVTTERPNLENDLISVMFGIVAIVCSTENVTSRSTSGAARDGDTVKTRTWLLVISGTASMGSLVTEYPPYKTNASVRIPTINLFLMEKEMIPFNILVVLNCTSFVICSVE